MKATRIIRAPLLANGIRPEKLAAAVYNSAAELEGDMKQNIAASIPTGKVYRRSPIIRKSTRRLAGLKLKKRGSGLIVGFNFHRASAKGQPPAIDSGRLLNSIRANKRGPASASVTCSVSYGLPLDDADYLDRPFFHSRAELYQSRFFENVRNATIS